MMSANRLVIALKLGLIGGCILLSSACGEEQHAALEQRFSQLQVQHEQSLADLEKRIDQLEHQPQYQFAISGVNHSINEQMFQPLLTSSARLTVKGKDVPQSLYVDVVLEVKANKESISIVSRQVFPAVKGRSKLEFQQPLPEHDLKIENMEITLKPLNWYQGEAIPESQIILN